MDKVKSNLHILMGKKKIRSINQLAKETGISRPTLTRIYNDESDRIEFETIYKLCQFFDCNVGDLFTIPEKEN
ncbi:helix-turn-helix transcriptional regulator [Bacillus sp. FJAT-49736]|uniref:helix-turn-helix domain-containing protein n=1 Tax=Bacillus sp. FJAT-49736 TaxID=2833582 RepID=UPI001BC99A93|nr:helix-turn-helix transcriptional regulator [Bacillus sp. FJAT-49736]MBS4173500.1 helix-turn-helix transcriptional regulator [Bacillus sp. FJAT-49736]